MIVSHVKPAGWVDTGEAGLIQPSEVAGLVHVVALEPADFAGLSHEHFQDVASDVWVIAHGLGKYPSVVTVDSANDEVEGAVHYDDDNQVTVTFSAPFGGRAFVN